MDFDSALEIAGSFGPAQLMLVIFAGFMSAYNGWHAYIVVFVGLDIDFSCADGSGVSKYPFQNNSALDKCDESCQKLIFEDDTGSIYKDYVLVCNNQQILATVSTSAYWSAFLISTLTCGSISEKFGRKWPSAILVFLQFFSTLATTFAPDIYSYIAIRFVSGFCSISSYIVMLILTENVSKQYVPKLEITNQLMFVIGQIACVLSAFVFEESWRKQFLTLALPLIPFMFFQVFLLPESARWLESVGRINEAEYNLKWIAKYNGNPTKAINLNKPDSESSLLLREEHESSKQKDDSFNQKYQKETETSLKMSVLDLFRTLHSCVLTAVNMLAWFACSMVYFGLIFNVKKIHGNLYLNSLLLSLVDVPSWFVSKSINRWGRKTVFYIALFVASAFCAGVPFIGGSVQIVFAMAGKCLATACYSILFVHCPEQFPSSMRNAGMSLCSAASKIALILTPFVLKMNLGGPFSGDTTPFEIFSFAGCFAGVTVCLFGVETKDKPTVETIEDYEHLASPRRKTLDEHDSL